MLNIWEVVGIWGDDAALQNGPGCRDVLQSPKFAALSFTGRIFTAEIEQEYRRPTLFHSSRLRTAA